MEISEEQRSTYLLKPLIDQLLFPSEIHQVFEVVIANGTPCPYPRSLSLDTASKPLVDILLLGIPKVCPPDTTQTAKLHVVFVRVLFPRRNTRRQPPLSSVSDNTKRLFRRLTRQPSRP
ncbi:unnamed protein product, partial [Ectocarpus fasciculatus]